MIYDEQQVRDRLDEMMKSVDTQVFLCKDGNEEVLFACGMLQRIVEIFDTHLGEEGRKKMFDDLL